MDAAACTTRADGTLECVHCGGPVEAAAFTAAPKPDAPLPRAAAVGWVDPPPARSVFCGVCGSKWPLVNGKVFPNCGHKVSEATDDPRHATAFAPPAGLNTVSEREVERRNAADAAKAVPTPLANVSGGTGVVVAGASNRLSIAWGESRFPVDAYNYFKVGSHIVTVDVPEGEDRLAVARAIAADLERIADELFERQRAWYEKKLASVK